MNLRLCYMLCSFLSFFWQNINVTKNAKISQIISQPCRCVGMEVRIIIILSCTGRVYVVFLKSLASKLHSARTNLEFQVSASFMFHFQNLPGIVSTILKNRDQDFFCTQSPASTSVPYASYYQSAILQKSLSSLVHLIGLLQIKIIKRCLLSHLQHNITIEINLENSITRGRAAAPNQERGSIRSWRPSAAEKRSIIVSTRNFMTDFITTLFFCSKSLWARCNVASWSRIAHFTMSRERVFINGKT